MSKFDYIYRRLLLTKFFTKGWGKPDNLKRLFEFRKTISNREACQKLVSKDYPVHIDKDETFSDCRIMEGHFLSPVTQHLPGIMPKEVQVACFQVVLPKEWKSPSLRPMCLHLAGTGDHYYWRRRTLMARPLIKEAGIGSIILENPYYGMRKPKTQVRSSLHNVSDLFVMGAALILESQVLLHWCEKNGWGPLGITGISMGGHMASLAATNWPKPISLVPCLSWSTASGVFTTGVLSGAIPWEVLQSQYLSDSVYQDEISKLLHSPEDSYNAGQSQDAYEMGKLFARRLDDLQKYQQECSLSGSEKTPPLQELQSDTGRNVSKSRPSEGHIKYTTLAEDLSGQSLSGQLKHGSNPDCDGVTPEGRSQETSFIGVSHKENVRVLVEEAGEICVKRELLNEDAPAQSGQNLSSLTDSAENSKQIEGRSEEPLRKAATGLDGQSSENLEGQLSYFGQQLETNETNLAHSSSVFHKELKHSEDTWTTSTSSPDSESTGRTTPSLPEPNVPSTPQFSPSSDFRSSKDLGPSIPDRKLSSSVVSGLVVNASTGSRGAGAPSENQSTGPLSASLETSAAAGAGGSRAKTSWGPLLDRLSRTVQQAIQSGPSSPHGQDPLTLQHAEAKSQLSQPKAGILRGTFGSQGTRGGESKEARMQEASNFMRGVMDECTHLGNFSLPMDTRLIIIIAAKQDAYVPRSNVLGLDKLWPGAEVRYIDRGHIAAFLLHQDVFRKAIIDAFDRQVKLYWNQDEGDHSVDDGKQKKEISGKK